MSSYFLIFLKYCFNKITEIKEIINGHIIIIIIIIIIIMLFKVKLGRNEAG